MIERECVIALFSFVLRRNRMLFNLAYKFYKRNINGVTNSYEYDYRISMKRKSVYFL